MPMRRLFAAFSGWITEELERRSLLGQAIDFKRRTHPRRLEDEQEKRPLEHVVEMSQVERRVALAIAVGVALGRDAVDQFAGPPQRFARAVEHLEPGLSDHDHDVARISVAN